MTEVGGTVCTVTRPFRAGLTSWRQVLVLDVRVEVGVLYKKVVQIKACLNTVTVGTVLQRQSI